MVSQGDNFLTRGNLVRSMLAAVTAVDSDRAREGYAQFPAPSRKFAGRVKNIWLAMTEVACYIALAL